MPDIFCFLVVNVSFTFIFTVIIWAFFFLFYLFCFFSTLFKFLFISVQINLLILFLFCLLGLVRSSYFILLDFNWALTFIRTVLWIWSLWFRIFFIWIIAYFTLNCNSFFLLLLLKILINFLVYIFTGRLLIICLLFI